MCPWQPPLREDRRQSVCTYINCAYLSHTDMKRFLFMGELQMSL